MAKNGKAKYLVHVHGLLLPLLTTAPSDDKAKEFVESQYTDGEVTDDVTLYKLVHVESWSGEEDEEDEDEEDEDEEETTE
jgi:hypothetical protein